ncbi:MAG: hypothetical protein CVU11_09355 [Bacteroidetes bacterium HGW-Bacteroidetes-6]|jgi:YD repeat-containing protein|nr:MAG: hypothetical protein CVU11_09355 [Bacteroidetes bacterium HGW-Bacteroidetes-6]
MRKFYSTFILILILAACTSKRNKIESENTDELRSYTFSDYDYEVRYYSNSITKDNFNSTTFYRNDTIIRNLSNEGGCTRYIYDSIGRLAQTISGRDCSCGFRKFSIYDSANNLIGYFSTQDSLVDLNTVEFDQTFFYNSNGQLIKERTSKGNDINGVAFERWSYFDYKDGKIFSETILRNNDTVWNCKYQYDSKGNLIKIHRTRDDVYETESFKYNKDNLLIKKEIISTANPVTPNISFCAGNNYSIFEYDSTGFLTAEIVYNHNGKQQVKKIYKKIYKNNS